MSQADFVRLMQDRIDRWKGLWRSSAIPKEREQAYHISMALEWALKLAREQGLAS